MSIHTRKGLFIYLFKKSVCARYDGTWRKKLVGQCQQQPAKPKEWKTLLGSARE